MSKTHTRAFPHTSVPASRYAADLAAGRPVIGVDAAGRPVEHDVLATESAHMFVAGASGGGVTVFLRGQVASHLARGAQVFVLDQRNSLRRWFDHPALTAVSPFDVRAIHDELVTLGSRLEERLEKRDSGRTSQQPVVVVVEDIPWLEQILTAYWRTYRPEGSDLTRSPAIAALHAVLMGGREAQMYLIGSAASSAPAYNYRDVSETFGAVVVGSGMTTGAWRTYAPQVDENSRGPRRRQVGHFFLVTGADCTEFQALDWSSVHTQQAIACHQLSHAAD